MKNLFLIILLFAVTLSFGDFLKANEDSEKQGIVNALSIDSDSNQNINFEIPKQLTNPGRMIVKHIGKEIHEFNFIYKKQEATSKDYDVLKPPKIRGLS